MSIGVHTTPLEDLIVAFQARFPELRAVQLNQLQAVLQDARLEVDPTYYGAKTDMAVMYLAAHMIALSPGGNGIRIDAPGKLPKSTYGDRYETIKMCIAPLGRPAS